MTRYPIDLIVAHPDMADIAKAVAERHGAKLVIDACYPNDGYFETNSELLAAHNIRYGE